jgi:hypothetical protein
MFQIPQVHGFVDLIGHLFCFLHYLLKFPLESSVESLKQGRPKAVKGRENAVFEPPEGLKEAGRRLWADSLSGWDIQPEQFSVLENLCRSQDRIVELQELLAREGMTTTDRFGQIVAHPATMTLRGESGVFARLYRLLQLEPPQGPQQGVGRPPGYQPG